MPENKRQDSIRKRHTKRQLKRRKQQLIRRYTFFGILALIAVCIILFVSPLFSIKSVNIDGNVNIKTEELSSALEGLKGENLFLTSSKDAQKALATFPYLDTATVKKSYFPPSVTVTVAECKPSFFVAYNNSYVIVDKATKVLEIVGTKPDAAELSGINVTSANIGEALTSDDSAKLNTVKSVLAGFDSSELIDGVTKINLEDISNISFNYEDRLDGLCGPYIDFGRKLSIFYEAVNSNGFTENTRGTIDLTKSGYAYYTP